LSSSVFKKIYLLIFVTLHYYLQLQEKSLKLNKVYKKLVLAALGLLNYKEVLVSLRFCHNWRILQLHCLCLSLKCARDHVFVILFQLFYMLSCVIISVHLQSELKVCFNIFSSSWCSSCSSLRLTVTSKHLVCEKPCCTP